MLFTRAIPAILLTIMRAAGKTAALRIFGRSFDIFGSSVNFLCKGSLHTCTFVGVNHVFLGGLIKGAICMRKLLLREFCLPKFNELHCLFGNAHEATFCPFVLDGFPF